MIRLVGKASRARSSPGECNRNGAVKQEAKIKEELSEANKKPLLRSREESNDKTSFSRSETSALYTTSDCQQTLHLGHVGNVFTTGGSGYPYVTVWLRACIIRILALPTHLMAKQVFSHCSGYFGSGQQAIPPLGCPKRAFAGTTSPRTVGGTRRSKERAGPR